MIIPIHYTTKYRQYPYAPKATQRSKNLGALVTWPALVVISFFWVACVHLLLNMAMGIGNNISLIAAFVTVVPMLILLFKWKQSRDQQIDKVAVTETAQVLGMTDAQRQQYEKDVAKSYVRRVLLVFGALILFVAILIAMSAIQSA